MIPRRGEGLWPLAQCLFAWKCLHFATQRAPAHFSNSSTRRGPMATLTVPFCLEMLTFGHPESSGALQQFLDAETVTGHSHSAFLLGNAYIWQPRDLRHTSAIPRRGEGDWPLSQCLFPWKCLHFATRELGGTSVTPRRGECIWPLPQCLFVWKCLHLATQRALGHSRESSTRGGPMATRTLPFCLEMLTFGHPESSGHF